MTNEAPISGEGSRTNYIGRLHDKQIEALVRSKRLGNFLLVGVRGSGATASLMMLSDQLIDAGLEHQLIPCGSRPDFVPPMARINLVDDLGLIASVSHSEMPLIDSLNSSVSRSLNIITARPSEAEQLRKLLRVSGEILIPPLSRSEAMEFYHELVAQRGGSAALDADFLDLLRNRIERDQLNEPRALHLLARGLLDDRGRLYYRDVKNGNLDIIRPKLITIQASILQRIKEYPNDLVNLSPVEFEQLVGELFEKEGYSIEFTKASRDGGVDIFARKRDLAGESLTIVQCKKYNPDNPVRVGVVREVVGSLNIHNATAAAIFTTSRFTKAAADEATKIRYRLSLNDYFEIMQSIAKHQTNL
jgi:hypothetical protein